MKKFFSIILMAALLLNTSAAVFAEEEAQADEAPVEVVIVVEPEAKEEEPEREAEAAPEAEVEETEPEAEQMICRGVQSVASYPRIACIAGNFANSAEGNNPLRRLRCTFYSERINLSIDTLVYSHNLIYVTKRCKMGIIKGTVLQQSRCGFRQAS